MKLKKIKNYILTFIICLFGSFAIPSIVNCAAIDVGNGIVSVGGYLDSNGNIVSNNILDVKNDSKTFGTNGSLSYTADYQTGIYTLNGSYTGVYGLSIQTESILHFSGLPNDSYSIALVKVGGTCSGPRYPNCVGLNRANAYNIPFTWVSLDNNQAVYADFTTSASGTFKIQFWLETTGSSSSGTITFNNFQFYLMAFTGDTVGFNGYIPYGSILFYNAENGEIQDQYNNGYNNGYSTGYTEGENLGYLNGYSTGYTEGENRGYLNGYNAGYDYGVGTDNTLVGMVMAIFTGPVTMFQSIFTFDILGINFAEMLLGLVTLLVVIWLIKRFV